MSGTSRFSEALVLSFLLTACGSAEDGAAREEPTIQSAPAPSATVTPETTQPTPDPPPAPKPKPPLDPLALRPAYTEYLGRLTTTAQNPAYPGMTGTDLGSSFERDGKLVFLFGDSLTTGGGLQDVDLAATTDVAYPTTGLPKLSWLGPLSPPGLTLDTMNVPVEGVAVGADTYVFFATKYDFPTNTYGGSAIAKTTGLAFDQLTVVSQDVPGDFANVSVVVENNEAFIFGTSAKYRESAVHLARVPIDKLADRTAWTITPTPVVDSDCAGELSVRKHPKLALYLMTFGCDDPRGTWLHLATKPEGPWISAGRIFDPASFYQRVMHANESFVGYDDGLAPPGNEADWGGEYAPYLVPQWFTQDGDAFGIVYTLSSWVPYQVHLVRTWLVPPDVTKTKPVVGAGLAKSKLVNGDFATGNLSGWLASGDGSTFGVFTGTDGKTRVTTYTGAKGDAAIGTLAQSFVVDASTTSLSFALHGGDARVYLQHGDDIVRSSRARRTQTSAETMVKWNLEDLRGETVTVVIEDTLTGEWGYVGARDFALQ